MTREQVLLMATLLAALGSLSTANASTWGEVLQPRVVFAALAAMGAGLRAVYTEKP